MGEFLSYSIQSGLLLLAMFLAFKLTLAMEKQHGYNRGIILSIYAIAFLAIPILHVVKQVFYQSPTPIIPDIPQVISSVGVTTHQAPQWGTVLIWIYIIGMVIVAAKTLLTWTRILRVIAKGEKTRMDGYTLVLTDDESLSPFSWMRYVVMNRADYQSCGEPITVHELKHINLYHCIDLLVAQAAVIINWFNPAAWMLRDELMLIHEYQADMAVIDSGHDARQYQMLLIKKAVGARFPSLANSLNHSKLKLRITMMYQEKSGKGRRMRAIAVVPALALALAATSIPQVQAAMSTIANSAVSVDKVTKNSSNGQFVPTYNATIDYNATNDTVVMSADTIRVIGYGTIKKDVNSTVNGTFIPTPKAERDSIRVRSTDGTSHPTVFVDGKEIPYEEVNNIDPSTIQEISVYKTDDGRGSIYITLKK